MQICPNTIRVAVLVWLFGLSEISDLEDVELYCKAGTMELEKAKGGAFRNRGAAGGLGGVTGEPEFKVPI